MWPHKRKALEAQLAESKEMQDRLTEALAKSNKDIEGAIGTMSMMRESAATMELALRIAHAFLRQNSASPSQAFNVAAMISETIGKRASLAGFEHAEYAKVVYSGATKLTTDR